MALNKFMHPRNIYKNPPDFKKLAITYPDFRKHVKQDVCGKVTIDFKDAEALRSLTCTLLKNDFGLLIEIPLNKMIPTLPLRVNYVLFIEDLLSVSSIKNSVKGIDIGTGASCIYPLLAAKKYEWAMLATDINDVSISFAEANIKRNGLEDFITVKKVSGETVLQEAVGDYDQCYDFCMCNPPFFSSTQELHPFFRTRKKSRALPKNAFCASLNEVVTDGGEVSFITKLILESKHLGQKIKIYTTMVGCNRNLAKLTQEIRHAGAVSFKQSRFCQGNTTRWGLAWTFCNINLRMIPEDTFAAAQKEKKETMKSCVKFKADISDSASLTSIIAKMEEMFKTLQLEYEKVTENKAFVMYCLTAHADTWSHQRRKRREEQRLQAGTQELLFKPACSEAQQKQHEGECFVVKKIKLMQSDYSTHECFLKFKLEITRDVQGVQFMFCFIEGTATVVGCRQILQYMKNNLKL